MSDNLKYFVFEGPNFDSIPTTDKKDKAKSKVKIQKTKKEQRILYAFELKKELVGIFKKKPSWKFVEYEINLDLISDPFRAERTRQTIDHDGIFYQAYADVVQTDKKYNHVLRASIK